MKILEIWEPTPTPRNSKGNPWAKNGMRGDDGFGGWMSDEGNSYMDNTKNDWAKPGVGVYFYHPKTNEEIVGRVQAREAKGIKVLFFRDGEPRAITLNPSKLHELPNNTPQLIKDFDEAKANYLAKSGQKPSVSSSEPQAPVAPPIAEYVPLKVPYNVKEDFKTIAAGSYRWNPEAKTWMIKSSALTPEMKQKLKNIGIAS